MCWFWGLIAQGSCPWASVGLVHESSQPCSLATCGPSQPHLLSSSSLSSWDRCTLSLWGTVEDVSPVEATVSSLLS